MPAVEFILCGDETINLYIAPDCFVVDKTHVNYRLVREELKNTPIDEVKLRKLLNVAKSIEYYYDGLRVENDKVTFMGRVLHGELTDRLLGLMASGADAKPFARFYANLMRNPSKRAVDALYDFLSLKGLPFTEDGCIIAYKSVTDEFLDWFSQTVNNRPGCKPEMPRNEADDNWELQCSSGFHVGSYEYTQSFHGNKGHKILVKFNPADVVSVPLDAQAQKLRVCKYEVLREYDKGSPLPFPLYGSDGEAIDFESFASKQEERVTDVTSSEFDTRFKDEDDEKYCENCDNPIDDCECGIDDENSPW